MHRGDDDITPSAEILPRLRLFLSVDLVGSTSFKQSARYPLQEPQAQASIAEQSGPWLSTMLNFYSEFTQTYAEQWAEWKVQAAQPPKIPTTFEPEFWKGNGDELLFGIEIAQPKEVIGALIPWIMTLRKFRERLHSTHKSTLDVKSTAWLAGFPINNSEIVFEQAVETSSSGAPVQDPVISNYLLLRRWYSASPEERLGLIKDYIGPSIDTGFRLSGHATPRKLVVSVEVALLAAHYNLSKPGAVFNFFFDGKETLKGVLGGKPYPIIWIDLRYDDPVARAEDDLRQTKKAGYEDIKRYCEGFFQENDGHMMRPFIWKCDEDEFNRPPPNYVLRLKALMDKLPKEERRLEQESNSFALAGPPGDQVERGDSTAEFLRHLRERVNALQVRVANLPNQTGSSSRASGMGPEHPGAVDERMPQTRDAKNKGRLRKRRRPFKEVGDKPRPRRR